MYRILTRLAIPAIVLSLCACSGGGGGSVPSAAPNVNNAGPSAGLASLTPSLQKEYSTPFGVLTTLAAAPDGKIWFGENGRLGLLNPVGGAVTQYNALAPGESSSEIINAIAAGADNSIWYTLQSSTSCSSGSVGNLNNLPESGGTPTVYTVTGSSCYLPNYIAVGSDGNIWVSAAGAITGAILKFVPGTTSGQVATYPVPFQPGPITLASDGSLWFIAKPNFPGWPSGQLARIDTSGNLSIIADVPGAGFKSIASASGSVWVTDETRNMIVQFTTLGEASTYPVPTSNAFSASTFGGQIVTTNGYVYVVQPGDNVPYVTGEVLRVNTRTGTLAAYVSQGCGGPNPNQLALDHAGNLWISDGSTTDIWEYDFPQ